MVKDVIISAIKDIALGLIGSSYWICLFVCMIAILFYMVGCKKSGRVASISIVVYVLSQAIKMGIK
jgi:hypothetical protein